MSDHRGAEGDMLYVEGYTGVMKFTVTYVRLLVRILKLEPDAQALLLSGTSLTPEMLENLDQQLSQEELVTILNNLLNQIDRPHLGLYVGSRMPVAAHGPLGQLLSSSPDLYTAWEALSRYQLLRLPLVNLHCFATDEHYIFELQLAEDTGAVGTFLMNTLIVTIQRGIELIIGQRLHDATVELTRQAPADMAAFAKYVPGTLLFEAPKNQISVPLSLMLKPNPYKDAVLWEQTLTLCEQLKSHQASETLSFSEQVRQLIGQQSGKLWSLDEIAGYFHVTPRTVMRRLKAEGTQYQPLLNAELEKHAKLYLSTPSHTVESAALSLGYQDTSAFRRAFRRWCGMSPSEWRQQQGIK